MCDVADAAVPPMKVAFSQQVSAPLLVDVDYVVNVLRVRHGAANRTVGLAMHRAAIWVRKSS
jgi:hypothetical protein